MASYLQLLLVTAGAACLIVVVKLLRFGLACLRCRRRFEASSIHGPPLTHPIFGEGGALSVVSQGWC